MHAGISALLEALASIEAQLGKLDEELKDLARRSEVAWRLMSVPSIGTITRWLTLPPSRIRDGSGAHAILALSWADGEALPIGGYRYRDGHLEAGRCHGAALSL